MQTRLVEMPSGKRHQEEVVTRAKQAMTRYQTAVVRLNLEGMSNAKIADELNISTNAVRRYLERARADVTKSDDNSLSSPHS